MSDGVYRTSITLPQYSIAGEWTWYVAYLYNITGNVAEYYSNNGGTFTQEYDSTSGYAYLGTSGPSLSPASITVTSAPDPDIEGPKLVYLQFTPQSIDVATQSQTVQVTVSASDDSSGFSYGYLYFVSPNGQQFRGTSFSASSGGVGTIYFPQYSQAGTWRLYYMYLYDMRGHATFYDSTTLPAGLPGTIQISAGLAVANVSGPPNGSVSLHAVLTFLGSPLIGEVIEFSLQGQSVGTAVTDATGTAVLDDVSLAGIASGTYVNAIGASFAGDGTHAAASGQGTLTVTSKLGQTITFAAITDQPLSSSPLTLTATASSGLAVSYATVGNCTASGSTLTLTAVGSCQVIASQSGNSTYNAAPAVSRSFTITGKTDQTISFGTLANKTYGDSAFSISASATSGLPVSFALGASSAGCSVSGTTVTITGATTSGQACVIVASQTGNSSYNAAPDVTRSFTIAKAAQTISFAALSNKTYGDPAFSVSASATSGLPVSFALGASSVGCSIAGAMVTITGATAAGQACIIVASQAGDANHDGASDVPQSFTIAKASQTITFAALVNKTYGDPAFSVSASATSGLPVSFALGASSVGCSISGATVTITGATAAGQACMLVASQGGNANYNAAPNVAQSFTIAKASQAILFAALGNKTYGDPAFDVAATATSQLPVSFSAAGGCTIAGATVTITTGGTCTITASQAGNANFNPAANVPQAFNVAYTWSNVLQPVNPDNTSVFKQGSTIPVKFQLTGSSAALTTLAAKIWVAQVSNSIVGSEIEALSTSAADSGNTFRYDPSAGQYVFNLSTKGLSQGTWQIRVDLLDNTSHYVLVSLKK